MQLDIRFPIGLLFTILGVILTGYGLLSPAEIYQRSLGININLIWGIVLTVFGVSFLLMAARSRRGGGK